MMRAREQRLELRDRARVRVPRENSRTGVPVHLAEIGVVAQPEHGIGSHARDAAEDLQPAPVRVARAVVYRLVHVEAAAQRYPKRRGLLAPLPQFLRLEA